MPLEACRITTPLCLSAWRNFLVSHPNRELVHFLLSGIAQGFRIGHGYADAVLVSAKKNLQSADEHPEVIDEYLRKEVAASRVVGPFSHTAVPGVHISRFGVIPKSHQPDAWRLIVDLSHPRGRSVNDGIPKDLCSMTYITVDDAIAKILALGPGSLLAKIDVRSAFRLLPVHPADRQLLAMSWRSKVFIDTCLPFGLRSSPKLFNTLADLLAWILNHQGVEPLLHYLDDFLTVGRPHSRECYDNLQVMKQVCQMLWVPLVIEKVEGPATSLEFLGITLDTTRMEARLPDEKLARIKEMVRDWMDKRKATKRQILSLVGLLQHAAKVVRPGRIFVRRMYSVAAQVKEMDHFTRLNKEFRSDLFWWYTFVDLWNGCSFLKVIVAIPAAQITIQTDASGAWGCGAYFFGKWLQLQRSEEWRPIAIMAKELVPIVLCCAVWGKHLAHSSVLFQCDNLGVVACVKKGTSKEETVMHLLRCLWFFTAYYDISISIEHIAGSENIAADQLSRDNMHSFFLTHPQASLLPTPLPPELLMIVAVKSPDWTSPTFRQLFKAITRRV